MLLPNVFLLLVLLAATAAPSRADQGYRLGLKFAQVAVASQRAQHRVALQCMAAVRNNVLVKTVAVETHPGILLLAESPANVTGRLKGREGFRFSSQDKNLVVASQFSVGVLYGVSALLRPLQDGQAFANRNGCNCPRRKGAARSQINPSPCPTSPLNAVIHHGRGSDEVQLAPKKCTWSGLCLLSQPIYSFHPWRSAENQKSYAHAAGKRFMFNWRRPPHYRDSS
ncbi:hypothetical protein Q5H92_19885 [Hymenobacter sp. M29]|uniref:Uncharacterized protein n=1 Tax=Hymenobacter mellowenesis TaxID=3063995 RepID=A0ABT9AFI2_9BACT|nr:hypothetical protein [Hymenobacter sp. M29]MDO7848637.1 hypothetical protein [Hymenobacter sp. M29]